MKHKNIGLLYATTYISSHALPTHTGAADGVVRKWNCDGYTEKARFFRPSGAVLSLEVCPALKLIVCGYRDGDIFSTSK